MPSFDEFFYLFFFLGEEVEEEINDDEDMLDGNPDDDEEEEEMSPMQIPNPFLGLSPQSITNAALALAAKANSNSNNQAVSLDEERKQRQQLLLGGEICTIHSFMDKEIEIAFLSFIALNLLQKGVRFIDTRVLIFTLLVFYIS